MSRKFPHYRQLNARDCGAVCLRMIAQYYGRYYSTEELRSLAHQTQEGATLLNISGAAEQIGMHTVGARLTYLRLIDDIPLPGIVHWRENHFVVVIEANNKEVTIADPDTDGVATIPASVFLESWVGDAGAVDREGVILLMEPTADFFSQEVKKLSRSSYRFVWDRFTQYKTLTFFLAAALVMGALLAVTFPFILQTMVDESIEHQNTSLLTMILVVWIVLFFSQLGLDFVRRFILFHVGSKVNIQLVTSFMMKILALPLGFFQSRRTDDVIQTLYANPRVQQFFTKEATSLIYSSLLLGLFSLVLLAFSWKIFFVFIVVSFSQAGLICFFLKKRKDLNFLRHDLAASHFSKVTDLIRGIKDIKLANAGRNQRWAWERSEARLFQNGKAYTLTDELSMQLPFFLGEFRNILIFFLAAQAVIEGSMTIGVLVAIVFILTQLNNPLKHIIEYFLGWQETKLSLERMDEVNQYVGGPVAGKLDIVPEEGMLEGEQVSFRYEGGQHPWVIRRLDFQIPKYRTTVIVGPSGSGKTTLLNLMLQFLQPQEGIIKFGGINLSDIEQATWLAKCGVVPQDGHLFYATIAQNIALGDDIIDNEKLLEASRIANILPFLERLPRGFNTMIGEGGVGLSKGQRQGVLIARAIYQNPDILFLDEATNDLDSENEKIVLKRISSAFKGKTLVIIASRIELPVHIDHHIHLAVPGIRRKDPGGFASLRGGNGEGLDEHEDEMLVPYWGRE